MSRFVPAYAAAALVATVFFFFLHHLGNRIPYELAAQRFEAESEAGRPDEGQARGYKNDYEYCEISETVMAGARWARDVDARFFVHLHPVDEADLPDARRQYGFDNLDFAFESHGLRGGGRCAAVRALPAYGIASIRTGQYTPGQVPDWDERVDLTADSR